MKNFRFKRLLLNDLDACAPLYISVFNSEPWNDAWTLLTAAQRLRECLLTPNALGLGVYEQDNLCAFALGYHEQWFTGKHFYLKEMCVATKFQRSGIGSLLMNELKDVLQQQQTERIYLLTSRGSSAEAFYSSLGFYRSDKVGLYALRLNAT